MLTSVPPSLRYDVALLYLKSADWNLESAISAYREDEQWESEHPLEASPQAAQKGKSAGNVGRRRFLGGSSSTR
jgi:hypothetical protein